MAVVYHTFKTIDSTNQFLKTLPTDTQTHVCRADMQTQGRGRLQREWHSPSSNNIYLSVRYPYTGAIQGLSLVMSLSLLKTIQPYVLDVPVLIKWPNDLLWHNKKLAGILIEIIPDAIIIGIGFKY